MQQIRLGKSVARQRQIGNRGAPGGEKKEEGLSEREKGGQEGREGRPKGFDAGGRERIPENGESERFRRGEEGREKKRHEKKRNGRSSKSGRADEGGDGRPSLPAAFEEAEEMEEKQGKKKRTAPLRRGYPAPPPPSLFGRMDVGRSLERRPLLLSRGRRRREFRGRPHGAVRRGAVGVRVLRPSRRRRKLRPGDGAAGAGGGGGFRLPRLRKCAAREGLRIPQLSGRVLLLQRRGRGYLRNRSDGGREGESGGVRGMRGTRGTRGTRRRSEETEGDGAGRRNVRRG
mmetsp:Transcript_29231/g.67092  ORF Transcript_29231/g.67092 Transcript_29231/m.67092 type:complete len:287 (-) Transcript_29231:1775-2635(-)